jgi:hypothetical protein
MLNAQNVGEDSAENNRILANSKTSDKVEMHVLDLEISITQIENSESPGYDEVSVGMIKAAAGPIGMHRVLRKVWVESRIPEDWNKGITVPVYKKRDSKQCGNYRGITLLCQTFKIMKGC